MNDALNYNSTPFYTQNFDQTSKEQSFNECCNFQIFQWSASFSSRPHMFAIIIGAIGFLQFIRKLVSLLSNHTQLTQYFYRVTFLYNFISYQHESCQKWLLVKKRLQKKVKYLRTLIKFQKYSWYLSVMCGII